MNRQDQKSYVARITEDSITANDGGFRRRSRALLAQHIRDEGGNEPLIQTAYDCIKLNKQSPEPCFRERAHLTERAIYSELPRMVNADDITKLWREAAMETDGSVRFAIQLKLHTIIDKCFDLITPETVKALAKTTISDEDWNTCTQSEINLKLVLQKEQEHGAIVSLQPILDLFREASGHANPDVRKNIVVGCGRITPFAGPEHRDMLASLILKPALYDKDIGVQQVALSLSIQMVQNSPRMIGPMLSFMRMEKENAQSTDRTALQYDATRNCMQFGLHLLSLNCL